MVPVRLRSKVQVAWYSAVFLVLFPQMSIAQVSEIEALRALVKDMQRQLQNALTRIDQLEQEKAVTSGKIEQLEQEIATKAEPEPASGQTAQTTVQSTLSALNPAITVVGNFLGRGDSSRVLNEDGDRISNTFNLRETEVDFRAAIDPYADGVLIASLESEAPGEFSLSVEEGYVNIKKLPFLDEPPLGLKLKVGRFRPVFGKFNVLHTHDLPFTFRSLPTEEFMGSEGFIANGLSGNFFVPTPWDQESSLDATFQVLGGGNIAISPDLKSRVSYLAHLRWYRTLFDGHDLELGWSSYGHPAGNGIGSVDFYGFDFLYRWKPFRLGQYRSFLLGGEVFFARRAYPDADEPPDVARAIAAKDLRPRSGKPYGVSLFTQWQLDQRAYAGLRWDQTTTLFHPGFKRRSLTPYLSYYLSEFLRARLSYEHRWSDFSTENNRNSVFFELNWVFGSHPPEPFWVNK